MPLPGSILTGLLEYWPFNEGAGLIAHGYKGELDLNLTSSDPRGPNGVEGLWNASGQPNGFAGCGIGEAPAMWELFTAVGKTVTLAVEHTFFGWNKTIDTMVYNTATDSAGVTLGSIGESVLDPHASWSYGSVPPPPQDPATNTHIYSYCTGNGVDHFINAPPYSGTATYVIVLEITWTSSNQVRTRVYVEGAQFGGDYTYTRTPTGSDPILWFGPYSQHQVALIRGAAVWGRALTGTERNALMDAGTLGGLATELSEEDPLLKPDGKSAICPQFDIPMRRESRHLSSVGEHRHTRQVHERVRRRYELPINGASGAEIALIRNAITLSSGGVMPVRWRHPQDDAAGPVETAPRWIIENAHDTEMQISRATGGVAGTVTLVLCEV